MVLLLGKGHEEFQLIKGARLPLGEREIVRQFSRLQPTFAKEAL